MKIAWKKKKTKKKKTQKTNKQTKKNIYFWSKQTMLSEEKLQMFFLDSKAMSVP